MFQKASSETGIGSQTVSGFWLFLLKYDLLQEEFNYTHSLLSEGVVGQSSFYSADKFKTVFKNGM